MNNPDPRQRTNLFLTRLQSRRPGQLIPASFPAHTFFHPWVWLCLLATLLCGVAVVTADDTRSSALTVSVNSSVTGSISEPGDVDYWRIDVPSAGQLVVETTGTTDTKGVLEDSEGNQLDEHDDLDYPSNRNFRIEWTVTAGTYYIRVRAFLRNTGDYTLHVRYTPEPGGGTGDTGDSDDAGDGETEPSEARAALSPVLGDFNGDGRDDVLLRHTDGRWLYYPMNGRNYLSTGRGAAFLTSNLDWQFAGIGDLNGDGKDDVLLRRVTDGRWYYYPMDGRRHLVDQRGGTSIISDLAWQFAGIGDLNGDGRDDVLLRHRDDGRWLYYPMDGRTHITGGRGLANITRDLAWQLAGIGDLNGDGRDDVLLRHTDGTWQYFPMNGRDYLSDQRGAAFLTSNRDWQFAGTGDLNGDGKDDVLLRHVETGGWYYYPMDGRRHITADDGGASIVSDQAWQLAGIGDLNGDGMDDVLLRHRDDGRWLYYPMEGRQHIAGGRGTANIIRDLAWTTAGSVASAPPEQPVVEDDTPDLVVESPSASVTNLSGGESFTLRATVRNQGAGQAGSTTLRYYRSSDSTIDSSDTLIGTTSISSLPASGSSSVSITLTAPTTAGTYYYGACVDALSAESESDTSNNCSSEVRVTVAGNDGDDHGDTRAGATSLAVGGSASGRIDPGNDVDYFIVQVSGSGTLTVYTTGNLDTTGALQDSSGARQDFDDDGGTGKNFRIEQSVSSGTYYIEVGSYQSNTGNYTIHVEFSGSGGIGGGNAPDLTVDTPTVSNNNPGAGATFTLRAIVRNQGNGSAEATTLRYYRSTDSTITSGDTSVGSHQVSALSASDSSSESINLSAPADVGTWYYGACVKAVDGESDTRNNCSDGVTVIVEDDEPEMPTDLVASYSNLQVAFNQETPNEISFSLDLNAFNSESREPASITSLRTPSQNYSNGIQQRYALQSISCASPGSRFSYNALLLFDRSGSMSGNDPQGLTLDAGKEFARRINSLGHGLIAQFSTDLPSRVEFITPQFTNNSSQLIMDINSIKAPNGGTPLWDAMIESIDRLNRSSGSVNKSALITFSDGEDTSSANSDSSVLRRALGDQILVYSVNLRNSNSHDLDNIALRTGGSAYSTDEASRLLAFYGTLGNLLSGNTSTCTTQINARVEAQDGRALGYGPGGSLQIDLEFSGNTDSGEGTALVENISMPFRVGVRQGATSTGVPVFASDFGEYPTVDGCISDRPFINNCESSIYVSSCKESLRECRSHVVDIGMQINNPFVGEGDGPTSHVACYWDTHNDQTFIPAQLSGTAPDYVYETFEQAGESDGYLCVYSKRFGI